MDSLWMVRWIISIRSIARAYIQAISKINEIKLNAKTLNYFLRRFISNARNFWSTIHSECLMATNIPFEQLSLPWSSEDQATTKKKNIHQIELVQTKCRKTHFVQKCLANDRSTFSDFRMLFDTWVLFVHFIYNGIGLEWMNHDIAKKKNGLK